MFRRRFSEEKFLAMCEEARRQHPGESEQQIRDRAAYRLKHLTRPRRRISWRLIFDVLVIALLAMLIVNAARCEPPPNDLRIVRIKAGIMARGGLFPQFGVPTVVRLQVRSAANVWTDVGFFGGDLNIPISGSVSLSGTNPFNLAQVGGTAVSGANVVDTGNTAFRVNCVVGCVAGGSFTDNTAFTTGATAITNIGGVFNDALGAVTPGNAAAPRITTQRGLHVNLRNNAGTEIGILATPLRVDPTGTTTQPISAASLPLPTGAATEATLAARLAEATFTGRINTQGQKTMAASTPVVLPSDQSAIPITCTAATCPVNVAQINAVVPSETTGDPAGTENRLRVAATPKASTLAVTALSAANTAVTATLPAAGAGLFHYINSITVTRTCTAAIVGNAALAVTTTNLPGAIAWTTGNACAVGSTNRDIAEVYESPLKSSAANTATTIVCPAIGAAGLCRITTTYYTAN
ncbi:MAG: hypothetical protein ACREVZ_12045 [Burkholderiales bacterium]